MCYRLKQLGSSAVQSCSFIDATTCNIITFMDEYSCELHESQIILLGGVIASRNKDYHVSAQQPLLLCWVVFKLSRLRSCVFFLIIFMIFMPYQNKEHLKGCRLCQAELATLPS